jgi:iron complex transport system permease protein
VGLASLGLAALSSLLASSLFGPLPIPADQVLAIIGRALGLVPEPAARVDPAWVTVVLDIRLSRIALAFLVGGGLAVSGAVFQAILRNPLADPFTLGVSSGAAFGASLLIALGLDRALVQHIGFDPLPLAGLAGALLALFAVLLLGRSGRGLQRETLVLAGVVVATFLSAFISLVKALDEASVASIVFWIMGSFQGRGWGHVAVFAPYCLLGLAVVWRYARELDLLLLGEVPARQLGMDVDRVRLILLVAASLMAGAAVAVSGIIGFVGLVVPHMSRLTLGAEHRPLLLASGLLGGVLLLWADVLARTILPGGAELPVGVVTALLGGPFFCALLRKRMRGALL